MIRRALACVSLFATFASAVALPACDAPTLPQDMCSWLKDENNCWQRFAGDVACAGSQNGNCGTTTACGGVPVEAGVSSPTTGTFAERDKLDICARSAGGQILFDPPLDASKFPLTAVTFKLLDPAGAPCAEGSYAGSETFSLKFEAHPEGNPLILGGTFGIAKTEGTVATFDVSCPGGAEQYHFNGYFLDKCLDQSVITPEAELAFPSAILESSPGAPEYDVGGETVAARDGFVRLRVTFPVGEVEYFNCRVPAPLPLCANSVKDAGEASTDCGGICAKKGLLCPTESPCVVDFDCASGQCAAVNGIRRCTACADGLTACGGACVDAATDEANCGSCGTTCGGTNTCCTGACVDTNMDIANCGACGTTCAATCASGVCT